MGFEQDWPRMNVMPEWFTVEPDTSHRYRVDDVDRGTTRILSGKSLSEGLPIRLEAGKALRLVVYPEGIWYGEMTPERFDRILQEHLIDGSPVMEKCSFKILSGAVLATSSISTPPERLTIATGRLEEKSTVTAM